MSDPVQIALVAEGPTDKVIIKAAIESMLGERSYILKQLQPEGSVAFDSMGTGWSGVYRWCRQAVSRSEGKIRNDPLFSTYDILIVQLDADVAENDYAQAGLCDAVEDLPCVQPCPPASNTTNALRQVLLRWMGEETVPPKTVLCTPSKSMETWVLAALFPSDQAVQSENPECWGNPELRLSQQPLKRRIKKNQADYLDKFDEVKAAWAGLTGLTEANRFTQDFKGTIPVG